MGEGCLTSLDGELVRHFFVDEIYDALAIVERGCPELIIGHLTFYAQKMIICYISYITTLEMI